MPLEIDNLRIKTNLRNDRQVIQRAEAEDEEPSSTEIVSEIAEMLENMTESLPGIIRDISGDRLNR